jgi:catechol 2,3-dioxygenase-like lactoylglutathione lyase family enzyme
MAVQHLSIVSIPVSDQQRAKEFYVNTLGFELRREGPFGEGMNWVEVAPPGAATALTLVTWFPNMRPGGITGLVLQTDDIAADFAALAERGVAFHQQPEQQPWGTFATFDDPDGNGWVLSQPPTFE